MNERRRLLLLSFSQSNPKFTITYDGVSYEYKFEDGMTWEQFINSSYNIGNVFTIDGNVLFGFVLFQGYDVQSEDWTGRLSTERPMTKIDPNTIYIVETTA